MTSAEYNEWCQRLHAHEAHLPIEMACGEPEDDDPADLAWLGMLIMLGSGAGVVALFALLLWWLS